MRGALGHSITPGGGRLFGRVFRALLLHFAARKTENTGRSSSMPAGRADEELAAAARHSPDAFAVLYRRYVQRVYRYFYSRVNNTEEAEDLTAEVFISAYEGLDRFRPGGNFAAWLFGIARNKARRYYRRWRQRVPLDETEAQTSWEVEHWQPLEDLEHRERLERLEELIEHLEPEQQELLRLRFAADLTFAEIAGVLGSTEAAVKMSLYRLLKRMNSEWET